MLAKALIVLGYYVVALAAVAAWIFVDHARTARKVAAAGERAGRLAPAFLGRVSVVLGLIAGVGTALMLELLLKPTPALWILALITVGDALITGVAVWVVVWSSPRLLDRDALEDLRPARDTAAAHTPAADDADIPL